MSTQLETKAFNYSAPGPCLLVKRKAINADNKLVEYVESTFRGDAYAYRVQLAP